MKPKKDTHKVGAKAKPRGQQMGTAGAIDQNRNAMQDTPAVLGRRRGTVRKNRLFLECGGSTPLWSAATCRSSHSLASFFATGTPRAVQKFVDLRLLFPLVSI
jgi:hypothetical protein